MQKNIEDFDDKDLDIRDISDYIDYVDQCGLMNKKRHNLSLFNPYPLEKSFTIQSVVYENPIYGNIDKMEFGVFNYWNYLDLKPDFFQYPFYISAEHLKDEDIDKLIKGVRSTNKDVPIILVNPTTLIKEHNVYYRFGQYVYFDDLYDSVIDNRLILKKGDRLDVEINYFNRKICSKIKIINGYMNRSYPNNELVYSVYVDDRRLLENVGLIVEAAGKEKVDVYFDDDLFSKEEKNPSSARQTLRNSEDLKDVPFESNSTIYYLNDEFYNVNQVLELEKMFDVILMRIPENASVIDKITFITLFLINYMHYDKITPERLRNMYEVLNEQEGVCRDFSTMFQVLMDRISVPCELVYAGNINGKFGHNFNVVNIDGQNLYVDVTFLMAEMRKKANATLTTSDNYLTSSECFARTHKSYVYKDYHCGSIDRNLIDKAVEEVSGWKNEYYINLDNLIDLFKMRNEKVMNKKEIIDALPSKGGRK